MKVPKKVARVLGQSHDADELRDTGFAGKLSLNGSEVLGATPRVFSTYGWSVAQAGHWKAFGARSDVQLPVQDVRSPTPKPVGGVSSKSSSRWSGPSRSGFRSCSALHLLSSLSRAIAIFCSCTNPLCPRLFVGDSRCSHTRSTFTLLYDKRMQRGSFRSCRSICDSTFARHAPEGWL